MRRTRRVKRWRSGKCGCWIIILASRGNDHCRLHSNFGQDSGGRHSGCFRFLSSCHPGHCLGGLGGGAGRRDQKVFSFPPPPPGARDFRRRRRCRHAARLPPWIQYTAASHREHDDDHRHKGLPAQRFARVSLLPTRVKSRTRQQRTPPRQPFTETTIMDVWSARDLTSIDDRHRRVLSCQPWWEHAKQVSLERILMRIFYVDMRQK